MRFPLYTTDPSIDARLIARLKDLLHTLLAIRL